MFRTELNPAKAPFSIQHTDGIFTIGSCFSDEIGQLFSLNKFNVAVNPFGTVYNPISIFKLLSYSIDQVSPYQEGYLHQDGVYHHFDFHSSFADQDKYKFSERLKKSIEVNHNTLKNADVLVITFGTAFIYEHLQSGMSVANCHKIPAKVFEKKLLTQKQIIESFGKLHERLTTLNTDIKILLTVSPVRHIKDSIELNSVSKSILRVACHTLVEQFLNVHYFPSYELILDDLRDYRFYKSDMIHPSDQAVDYIWEKFQHVYFDEHVKGFIEDWKKISTSLRHRPFDPNSEKHQKFIRSTIQKIEQLDANIDFSQELNLLRNQLIK